MAWIKENESAVIDLGSSLGDSVQITRDASARGDDRITGYMIVQGESIEEISRRFAQHPHLHIPGDAAIQILEFLPLPGV